MPTNEESGPPLLASALSLSLGTAVALGVARFSYALLLPPMKADLGWSFAQAGAMNTGNAVGYLIGALVFPMLSRHVSKSLLFLIGCIATTLLMASAGFTVRSDVFLAQRLASGLSSALIFVAGGVLATRLASAHPHQAGLVLGLYYGGTGWGIAASALIVPLTLSAGSHGWQSAWIALAAICALFSLNACRTAMRVSARSTGTAPAASGASVSRLGAHRFAFLLAAYGLFGIGYIGYMTFVIALLRGAGMGASVVVGFFVVLGLAIVASARLWSGLLDRARGGRAFALLSCLLGVATLVPTVSTSAMVAFVSGILFGATFLSVVASTTAFVRHNLPPALWSAGISVFTIVFALGQIVGPMVMGRISDGAGLSRGFVYSAIVLLLGAGLAAMQKPLAAPLA
jgi:predicted MFS family arabinose efflux permease